MVKVEFVGLGNLNVLCNYQHACCSHMWQARLSSDWGDADA